MEIDILDLLTNLAISDQVNHGIPLDENVAARAAKEIRTLRRKMAALESSYVPTGYPPEYKKLYIAVNEMMAQLGADGDINARSSEAEKVMDVLHEIDGGVYSVDKVFGG